MAVWGNLGPVRVIRLDESSVQVDVGEGHCTRRVDVPFSVIEVGDLSSLEAGEDRDGLKVEPWFSRKVKEKL